MILLWEMACELNDFLESKRISNRDDWMGKLIRILEVLTVKASLIRRHLDVYTSWDMYEETTPTELEPLGGQLDELYKELLTTVSQVDITPWFEIATPMESQQAENLRQLLLKVWDNALLHVMPYKSMEDVLALRLEDLPRYPAETLSVKTETELLQLLGKPPTVLQDLHIDGKDVLHIIETCEEDLKRPLLNAKQQIYDSLRIVITYHTAPGYVKAPSLTRFPNRYL